MSKALQISDAEWDVMKVLWREPGLTVNEVADRLADAKNWHAKTVRTMLTRLQQKGLLQAESVHSLYRYTPLLDRDACMRAASESFLDRVFDGALSPMVTQFMDDSDLTREDKAQLERILGKYEQRDKGDHDDG